MSDALAFNVGDRVCSRSSTTLGTVVWKGSLSSLVEIRRVPDTLQYQVRWDEPNRTGPLYDVHEAHELRRIDEHVAAQIMAI